MDIVRCKFVPNGPEEYVRQDVLETLVNVYGYPLTALFSEELVERGGADLCRADVVVQLPVRITSSAVSLLETDSQNWWDTLANYPQQYEIIRTIFEGTPGLKLFEMPPELNLEFRQERISCRPLGFGKDSYGISLALLPTMASTVSQHGLPLLNIRVLGYGLTDQEKQLAASLGIPECVWTEPCSEKATKSWVKSIDEYPGPEYSYTDSAFSNDGKVAIGILFLGDSSRGVLAALDCSAKGLKAFAQSRSQEYRKTINVESIGSGTEAPELNLTNDLVELSTFIVVECKAPCVNYTDEVLAQGRKYAERRRATFLVLTNGNWTVTHWRSPEKGWIEVDDIPDYSSAIKGEYEVTAHSPILPHIALPEKLDDSTVLFHARDRQSLGCDSPSVCWPMLLRLEDFLQSTPRISGLPDHAFAGLTILEDLGIQTHEVGSPSGGRYCGEYRTLLVPHSIVI